MNFKPFIEYLEIEKNYSALTTKAYRNDLIQFSDFIATEYSQDTIHEVNYQQIRQFIVTLVKQGITNRSINRKISTLKTYYKFLLKIGDITVNPLVKHKALKVDKKVQVPFSEEELKTVINLLSQDQSFEGVRNKLIVELFYATGMRRAELINLKLQDVDLQKHTIKVLGKRNKERLIPLLPSVETSIKTYLEARKEIENTKEENILFLTQKGNKIYETLVYRIINEYFSKASTKVKTSPHIIRHSFATHLLNQGANLNAVKELLGHSSLVSTQVYTHSSIAELKKVYLKNHPRSPSSN